MPAVAKCAAAQRGFGLVETMIALTIGLLLIAIATAIFHAGSMMHRASESLAELHEQGSLALEMIGRDIRQAGHSHAIILNQSQLRWTVPQRLWGCDGRPFASGLPDSIRVPVASGMPCGVPVVGNASDSLFVHHESGEPAGLLPGGGAELHLADATRGSGATCQGNRLPTFSIDRLGVAALLPATADPRMSAPAASVAVVAVAQNYYYVDKSAKRGIAGGRLMCAGVGRDGRLETPQPLVQGVEDLQLTYGLDQNADGAVDLYKSAADITRDAARDEWLSVVSVHVCLLMRTQARGIALAPHRELDCQSRLVSASHDERAIWRTFSATFNLRNSVVTDS